MDCKCQNQQCPPFAFTEKPLVDGMTYEAWQALPDKRRRSKRLSKLSTALAILPADTIGYIKNALKSD
jgi:hypothetical protein